MEENTSLFTDDAATPCDFNIIDHILSQKIQMIPTLLACQNHPAFTGNKNTHTETLLANRTYNIMILTIKIHLHSQMIYSIVTTRITKSILEFT